MASRILDNLSQVRGRIAAAAERSGRTADAITLVAVTKYSNAATARALVEAGCADLGEARPQELWQKAAELADLGVRWHLIGHLQRNKLERTLPLVALVHSADSWRLVEALDAGAAQLGRRVPILLEVNISGDVAKHGFRPEELEPRLEALAGLAHLDVRGLMGMSGLESDVDTTRREFAALRGLGERLRGASAGRLTLPELSMGMSGDFEAAIEEGATIVRVGSALVEGVE